MISYGWKGTSTVVPYLSNMAMGTLTALLLLSTRAACETELMRWLRAGNVADFLELREPSTITIPLALNIFFVGFHGEGAAGLNISEAQLRPWLQQLRAHSPHSVLTTDVEGAPLRGLTPVHSAVQYATHVRVLRLGPEVTARVESFLESNLRPENMNTSSTTPTADLLQVDAHTMSSLLTSLTRSLQLPGFSLFVLNPRRKAAMRYG